MAPGEPGRRREQPGLALEVGEANVGGTGVAAVGDMNCHTPGSPLGQSPQSPGAGAAGAAGAATWEAANASGSRGSVQRGWNPPPGFSLDPSSWEGNSSSKKFLDTTGLAASWDHCSAGSLPGPAQWVKDSATVETGLAQTPGLGAPRAARQREKKKERKDKKKRKRKSCNSSFKKFMSELPLWLSGLRTRLVCMRIRVVFVLSF